MPGLFKRKKSQSKDAKQRFEHLMLVAKENPDKVFDLSNCELSAVPPSLFVQCRVFLSESLLLHSNLLKSLKGGGNTSDLKTLRVLDIHDNALAKLPEDIGCLTNLQVLNLENNKLTELPESIGDLKKLQSLLARDNLLTCIPSSIRNMASLRTLDISGTNKVYYLPKTLCYAQSLEVLILSKPHCMEYPPPMVATEGLEAIQKFICKDCGVQYVPPSHNVLQVLDQVDGASQSTSMQFISDQQKQSQTSIELYQQQKEEKRKQQLELERQIAESQREQAMLSVKAKDTREKDQAILKKDYEKFDESIRKQHEKKDQERKEMLKTLKEVEKDASSLVSDLINVNEKAHKMEALLEEMDKQRRQEEQYFRVTQEDLDKLRKQDTLAAMEKMLAENDQYNSFIQKYLNEQQQARKMTQATIGVEDEKILSELQKQQSNQGLLVQQIMVEENFQKEAFAALQFQRDAVQMRLMNQIGQLQEELVKLTVFEAEKKKMKSDVEQETLQSARTELTDLLVQLLKEKDHREEMLTQRLTEMEQQRENDQVDFWLVQYQRLLDTKPEVLQQKEHGLDAEVVNILRLADAGHHIPGFARHRITEDNVQYLDDKQLQSMGVFEIGLRHNILREIENYIARVKKVDAPYEPTDTEPPPVPVTIPSAPEPSSPVIEPSETPPAVPTDASKPSAPPADDNECVICLDAQSDCVFLPCGHVCCCYQCSINLRACPMCRAPIIQKVKIFRS